MTPPDRLPRFTPVVRFTHRAVAVLATVLLATGLVLYLPSLSLLVGRRPMLEAAHVAAGLLLPLPVLIALATRSFRADLGALNRFTPSDWAWLRHRHRRTAGLPVGKFNAGQKLAASAFGAAGVVLLGTGLMLLLPTQLHLSDSLREGATVVHDATTLALLVLLIGHARLAFTHPEARQAMRTGSMDLEYAQREHGEWAAR
jgi:formate dehydrogenase subunit gamma